MLHNYLPYDKMKMPNKFNIVTTLVYVVLSLDKNAYSISAYTLLFVEFVWRQLRVMRFLCVWLRLCAFFIVKKSYFDFGNFMLQNYFLYDRMKVPNNFTNK